jgi:hypothetical protein
LNKIKKLYLLFGITVLIVGLIFDLPQKSFALSWQQVATSGLGGGVGNSTAVNLVNFNDKIYATIGNYDLPTPTGVQIFSSADGQTWMQVNTSGFGAAVNLDAVMAVYGSALYVGTDTVGAGPAQLWKTTNGTTWTQVGQNGLGDVNNTRIIALGEFNDKLYIGMSNAVTGAEVFSLDSAGTLTKVNTDGFDGTNTNNALWSLQAYDGALYASTGTTAVGGQLWKTENGTTWNPVMQGGFGDVNNGSIPALFAFGGKLYAGTINNQTGTEIWRTMTNDSNWEQVNTDGFGDALTFWSGDQVAIVNGTIYLGTRNDTNGARLFTSTNGTTWTQEGTDGFGDAANNFAMYSITFNGRIYLGISSNTGAEIWRSATIDTLAITSESLNDGTVGSAYEDTAERNGAGTTPFVWSLVSGSLPGGLSLSASTGTISGTPTTEGTYTFTLSVMDAGTPRQLASKSIALKVNAPAPETLPETGGN